MIEFLLNNAIWIIVVIIFLMAIIGYYAENSELGKKIMKPKEKKAKVEKKPEKPQTFEEAIKQIDKNEGIASVIGKEAEKTQASLESKKNEDISEVAADDAWSNNVDTDAEKPQEVVQANPDEWLNAPVSLSTPVENKKISSDSEEIKEDSLYDLPNNDEISEVDIMELPNEEYTNIEVLDVSDEFEDVEVLDVKEDETETNNFLDDFENPVEETLAQLDNSNEEDSQKNIEETSEKTSESEDIWK